MAKQLIFILLLILTLICFGITIYRMLQLFKLTKTTKPLQHGFERLLLTLKVAMGQTKILRKPYIGLMHALVFWGFLVITLGSIEMVMDGITGKDHFFANSGWFYSLVLASADIFAYVVAVGILVFLFRRKIMNIHRFTGIELSRKNKQDATVALLLILFLMVTLVGINWSYSILNENLHVSWFPISSHLATISLIGQKYAQWSFSLCRWGHLLGIFIFANYLPYSKHFHVFMSIPNVYCSNLEPLAKLPNMQSVTQEVKLMMSPNPYKVNSVEPISQFGVKDAEDVSWKNYMDALTCTQCGRCTEVCPANITGKKLSPRKIFVDLRNRMNEKGPNLIKNNSYTDHKSLVGDCISYEELWACTTCNACAQECPLNISHPNLIVDMRRYLVLEKGLAPSGIKTMFANIENNGAPWQFSPQDRLEWTKEN
jgi:heterodisulfide reductase subunit C